MKYCTISKDYIHLTNTLQFAKIKVVACRSLTDDQSRIYILFIPGVVEYIYCFQDHENPTKYFTLDWFQHFPEPLPATNLHQSMVNMSGHLGNRT